METIKQVLMRRDGLEEDEADELIEGAKLDLQDAINEGDLERAEDICSDHFGLEPDYLMELI